MDQCEGLIRLTNGAHAIDINAVNDRGTFEELKVTRVERQVGGEGEEGEDRTQEDVGEEVEDKGLSQD